MSRPSPLHAFFQALPLVMLTCTMASCGINAGNPKKPDGDDGASESKSYVRDLELISAHVDETANMLADLLDLIEPQKDIALIAAAKGSNQPPDGVPTIRCSENDGIIKNTVEHTGNFSGTFQRHGVDVTSQVTTQRQFEMLWTGHNGHIGCAADGSPALDWSQIKTYQAQVNFSMSSTRTHVRAGVAPREFSNRTSGSREFNATVALGDDGTRTVKQSVRQTLEHVRAGKGRDGPFSFVSSFTTPDQTSLEMSTTYDSASGAWRKHQLSSGQILSSIAQKPALETSLHDLVFVPEGGCLPMSGRIEGIIHVDEEVRGQRQFVVEFTADTVPQIVFADGSVAHLEADICELETRRHR